jgi:hypothetical protein
VKARVAGVVVGGLPIAETIDRTGKCELVSWDATRGLATSD